MKKKTVMAYSKPYFTHLPEEILEKQICTVCKKYLSFSPTKIYSTGQIKCGRCSKDNDFGIVSTFNKFAEKMMFPCVNRYEGCHEWLAYNDVAQHELKCEEGLYPCPICPTDKCNSTSVLYLINHFTTMHKKYLLNTTVMQIDMQMVLSQNYLYYNPYLNQIFLFFLRIDRNILYVNASTVGRKPELIKQQVILFENYPQKVMSISPWKHCSSWNTNMEPFSILLTKDLQIFSIEFQFKCSKNMVNWNFPSINLKSLEISTDIQGPAISMANNKLKKENIDFKTSSEGSQLSNMESKYRKVDWNLTNIFPKFCLQNIKNVALRAQLRNSTFSPCGKYIVSKGGVEIVDIKCSFCENYYPLIYDNSRIIHTCSQSCLFSLCNRCINSTIRCPDCLCKTKEFEDPRCLRLEYYCRFDCGNYCEGSELYEHEQNCYKNIFSASPDSILISKHFGINFFPWASLFTTNTFFLSSGYFDNQGRAYVIDQRGFKYVLDFKNVDDILTFIVYHEYDPTECCVVIKIFENNGFRELKNTCTFSLSYSRNTQFAIVLKHQKCYETPTV